MTRTAARAAVLGLADGLVAALGSATPATSAPTSPTPATTQRVETTRVVLGVQGCERCRLRASSYVAGTDDVWSSRPARVRDGRAVLRVPTARTEGMTVAISAPWQKHLPAVGHLVFRYAGQQPGDRVTRREAREARRGSACFPGIDAPRIRLKVRVVPAHFPGNGGRANGPAAYTVVSQPTVGNQERVVDGFYGAQDVVPPCD